jgi:ornithine cyclodeaminase/alanine dehydrogenase-like protein (mu-crystallin family)
MTLILTASEVAELLTLDDCIAAVEDAFRAHGEGKLHPPGILSEHAATGAFHIKTSTIGRHFAAKANANFPGRQPTIQGLVLLFDTENGTPLAVMDSIEITARRTAAASAVAAKYLARKQPAIVTVFGCGRQGRIHLEAIRRVVDVRHVYAIDTNREAAASLSGAAAPSLPQIQTSDIILTCTTSRTPILHLSNVKPGAFIAAVGADNPAKSEIDPELMAASAVVTDITEQSATIGDLHHAIEAGLVTRDHVRAELGQVVAGAKPGRLSDDEIVIFDSTGAGFQDTAAAAIVYERARQRGIGTEVRFA